MFFQKLLYGVSALCLWSGSVYAENITLYAAENLNFSDKDGIQQVYDANGKPFSGAVELPDSAGHNAIYLYKDGQKNGIATIYYDDKKSMLETSYANGRKNGVEVAYYPNGNPQYRRTYKDDILNGEEILFTEAGKPQKQSNYTGGVLNGTVNYFDDEGNLSKVETYKNGIKDGIERIIKDNSLMAEDIYVNGRINGVSKRYNEKYLTDEIDYVDNRREGWHKHYAADGSFSEIPYHNDKKNGKATTYRPNKNVALITMYADDMKSGFEQKFAEDDSSGSIENYRNDQLQGIARYFNKNELTVIKYFRDGAEKAAVDLQYTENIAPLYQKYKEGKIGPLLKQRNLWYRILWLGITLKKTDIIEALEKAMRMYDFAIDDMAVYQRFSGADFADQTAELYFGMSPFMYAAAVPSSPEIIQKFKSQSQTSDADGETPLQYAVLSNNADSVKLLLSLQSPEYRADDMLLYALQNGAQAEIIAQLLKISDVKSTDKEGHTPLYYAVKHKASPDVIAMLVNAGADIAQPQYKHLLTEALQQNETSAFINMLLDKGVDASMLDDNGHSAFYYAEVNNYPAEIIEKLRADGVVLSNADKQALLKDAAERKDAEILQRLNIPAEQLAEITDNGRSALQYAYDIAAPDEIMNYLLDGRTDINHQDRDGNTILHDALAKGDTAAALKFIENGAAVNIVNNYGKSAISYVLTDDKAAKIYDDVWSKVDAADVMMKMPESELPLWKYLYQQGNLEALKTLLNKVENPLLLTDENGQNVIDLLQKNSENADFGVLVSEHIVNNDMDTLRAIVKRQQIDLLRKMAVDKLDLEAKDEFGETLLTSAYKRGTTTEFLQALLDKGANINQRNSAGKTVFDLAVGNKVFGVAKYLAEHGADINNVNNDRTSLMDCRRDSSKLTDLLIANNASVSHVTADGETTLMATISNLNVPLVKYVLEHNVDTEAKDNEGLTAVLYLAKALEKYGAEDADVREDVLAVLKLLGEHNADVNARDYNGQTILVVVARQYPAFYSEFAEAFIAAGGNPEIKDQYDKKAGDYIGGQ